jgi:2-methylisocitrate lyase-like PEP mutase family enzyme
MAGLAHLIARPEGVVAPLVLNPLMARFAEAAGFHAGYVGGGALGFLTGATEANLSLTQMVHAGHDIRAHSRLALVLDGTCGWGDPVHVRHSVQHAQAAGFDAIEIEDQILPKRVHHHVGVEHVVPLDLMQAKIAEAVAARTAPAFLVIARTNAARVHGLDDALLRAEALRRAGADVLLVMPRSVDDLPAIAQRLPPPLMYMLPTTGVASIGIPLKELASLGFKLIVDPATPLLAMSCALRSCYGALAVEERDPTLGDRALEEERAIFDAIGIEELLAIERRTTERSMKER